MVIAALLLLAILAAAVAFLLGRSLGSRAGEQGRATHALEAERRLNEEAQRAARADAQAAGLTAERERLHQDAVALRTTLTETQKHAAHAREALAAAEAQVRSHVEHTDDLRHRLQLADTRAAELATQLHSTGAELEGTRRQADTESREAAKRLQALTDAEEKLSNQFKVLAEQIFQEKSARFREESEASLGTLLNPLKERMGDFQQKVEALQHDGIKGRTELREQLGNLRDLNQQLSNDAGNLARALKGSSKVQGDWGEMLLERMLESAGLRAGREYRVQQSFTTEDGRQSRPDIILDMPGDKHMVIDSKVSLNSYVEYCGCEEDIARKGFVERHARALKTHIEGLSAKSYQTSYGLRSVDFVVMFVPIEPAYLLAISSDDNLWQHAWDRKVVLASPGTLFPVLRTIAHVWRQERQNQNVEEIVRQASALYDKVAGFAETFLDVGKRLDGAKTSYEKAFGQLKHGSGDVMGRIERMRKLGLANTKKLPSIFASDEESESTADETYADVGTALLPGVSEHS